MTLCQKKILQYQYAPLRGVYKPDAKAFFCKTSLEGQTTWSKMEDFYNVDFHSAWPGEVKWFDPLDLSYRKKLLDMLWIDPKGVREGTGLNLFESVFEKHTIIY